MSSINFKRTYSLKSDYANIKDRAFQILGDYLEMPGIFAFNDLGQTITFTSERLIPIIITNRPRVMLLFSNPHPNSIRHGMFLSPNTRGHENLFWPAMRGAGWINIQRQNPEPVELADICLNVKYQGPFDLVFYAYYSFPTNYPEDIIKIFGKQYFEQIIEPEARDELDKTLKTIDVAAVVAFNKGVFNLVSTNQINQYIDRLTNGEVIQGQIRSLKKATPTFLTYPTGWRYHKQYMQLRIRSLEIIRREILENSNHL